MKNFAKMLTLAALTLAFVGVARAENTNDVTGKWTGQFNTKDGVQKYTFDLKVDGRTLTGTAIGVSDTQTNEVALTNGGVNRNRVFFIEPLKIQDQDVRVEYRGFWSGDEIKFYRKVGNIATEEFTVKRVE